MNHLDFVDVQSSDGKEVSLQQTAFSAMAEDYFQSYFSQKTHAVSVLLLCMHENTQLTFSISSVLCFCNHYLAAHGLVGRAFWLNHGFLFFLIDNPLGSEEMLSQQVSPIINELHHTLGAWIRYQHAFLCPTIKNIKKSMEPVLFSMIAMQYYELTAFIRLPQESCAMPLRQTLHTIEQDCELGRFEAAAQTLRAYVQHSHQIRKRPDEIKSDIIRILYAFTAIDPAGCEQLPLPVIDNILQSTSYRQTERVLDGFLNTYIEQLNPVVHHIPDPIRDALQYIQDNYQHPLRLFEVAEVIHLNKSYFSQLFQKTLGVSYSEYLETLRIRSAKRLLRVTSKSTAEISEIVGFSSQNYFAKVFKSCVGVSPSQFRCGKTSKTACS